MNLNWHQWLSSGLLLLDMLIILVLLPTVIQQRRESGATLAWVLAIVFLPFIGLISFWLFGTTRLYLRRRKRRKVEERLAPELQRVQSHRFEQYSIAGIPPSLLKLAHRLDHIGPVGGNQIELYRDGKLAFQAIEDAIAQAQHHIHLQYYIWEVDATGRRIRDALIQAAQRGVEVRLCVDDVGSRSANAKFFKGLTQAGGQVARFLKVNILSRRINLNNRNHRKVVVIDGLVAFTGGMNVGDAYAGIGEPWQDLHARIEGPVAKDLQEVFCQDWYHATNENLINDEYFPPSVSKGDIKAQFLASGPADRRWQSIYMALFAAINLAEKRVWIETPYFVPDRPLMLALQTAALRGVDVRILLPGQSDHALVLYAGRSFIDELLAAGTRIFEYQGAMTHSKALIFDSKFATLGSANMDQRSFRLNFEGNIFFYSETITQQMEADFLKLCASAVEITVQRRKAVSKTDRLLESAAHVMAPLL